MWTVPTPPCHALHHHKIDKDWKHVIGAENHEQVLLPLHSTRQLVRARSVSVNMIQVVEWTVDRAQPRAATHLYMKEVKIQFEIRGLEKSFTSYETYLIQLGSCSLEIMQIAA